MNASSLDAFMVHCGSCAHEWAAADLPLSVEDFAKAVEANAECPNCGFGPTLCGLAPVQPAGDGK